MNKIQTYDMVEKLKDAFDEMLVYKDLQKANFTASFKLPSFMRDWVLKRFEDDDGKVDIDGAKDFITTFIPRQEHWKAIKNKLIYDQERVEFLAKISVDIDIKTQAISFKLPDFNLGNSDTVIKNDVWERCRESLLKAEENWGIVELEYQYPDPENYIPGKIKLVNFKDFCPYTVDLDDYKYARKSFSTDEWIDIILGAVDYNASGYNPKQKIAMITRLLPFVEKRLNMIELAPKGTGKSYFFGSISRFGWLSSGGSMTRAKLFYDMQRRTEGLVKYHDYIALDEVKTITFPNVDEMRGVLKGYMENGKYTVGNHDGMADSGIILLGNIPQNSMNQYVNMFKDLPVVFHDSALIDRFHGFLKGWDIPRMTEDFKICGWALNSEYFSTVMHEMREDPSYRAIVDELTEYPESSDTRDIEAIKRISTAYLKLLFPNAENADDISASDFENYCLKPAKEMRSIIKLQLGILDPDEFGGKSIPDVTVRSV